MTDNPKNNNNRKDILKILRSMGMLMGHSALLFANKNKTINELQNIDDPKNKKILKDTSNKIKEYILNNIKMEDLFPILLSQININKLTYLSYKNVNL